jgi:CBS domain containing-hemolysin-like protein
MNSAGESDRREMQLGDWINVVVNLLIGLLLGSAVHGLVEMVVDGFWLMAVVTVVLFTVVFLFVFVFDKIFDLIFPIGIRAANAPENRGRKPLARVLSLPLGFVLGVLLAMAGLDGPLLDLLS